MLTRLPELRRFPRMTVRVEARQQLLNRRFARDLSVAQFGDRAMDEDLVQPGGQLGLASKPAQPLERADERVLGEFARQLVVSREPVGETVDAVHVGVVQRALRGAVPGPDSGNQFAFVHQAPSGGRGQGTAGSVG